MSQWTRRQILQAGAAVAAGPLLTSPASILARNARRKGLNVLWIGIDDLRCGLGCYGDKAVKSPHIDALARGGVTFRHAYVQQAVCAASRASFLTGCRPDTTTVDYPYNNYFRKKFLPEHPTVPTWFDRHGYFAQAGGKIHHGRPLDLAKLSGEYINTSRGDPWWQGYANAENRAVAENHRRKKAKQRPPAWEIGECDDEGYRDGRLASAAIEAMRSASRRDEPWFITPGFVKPHLPFCAPRKYWELYDRDEIDLAPCPHLPDGAPRYATVTYELPTYGGGYGRGNKPVTDDLARTLRHAYYACTSYIDAQVGRLLAALEELKLRDRTIVMLWSDHGWHLGDQGMWGKHVNYEWATRSPLIVSAPGRKGNGKHCDALVEYVDMFPTLCELTGVEAPDYLEGSSLVPFLDDPTKAGDKAAFSQYPRGGLEGYAVRTERYRYVEWRKKARTGRGEVVARELYDHRTDPHESVNVADKHPDVCAEHAALWPA
jgi:arylsulfatase A-like enzyme